MRATLLAVSLALTGCGKGKERDDTSDDGAPAQRVEKKDRGPAQKVDANDLVSYYRHNDAPHQHHNKLVVVRAYDHNSVGAMAGDEVVIMHDSEDGFRRPNAVFRFEKSELVRKGKQKGTQYIEGYLRGPVAFESVAWAKDWLSLSANPSNPGSTKTFVLVDDCRLVK